MFRTRATVANQNRNNVLVRVANGGLIGFMTSGMRFVNRYEERKVKMNSICLIGRLTADVELRATAGNGVSVAMFSIAVKRPGVKDTVDFINCVAWRNTAEFVSRHFSKGQQIAVRGYLTQRQYEANDGTKRTIYEVVCEQCEFAGSKPQEQQPAGQGYGYYEMDCSEDNVPF